jgi:hypothetical protein
MSLETRPSADGASSSPLPDTGVSVADFFRPLESGMVAREVVYLGSAG